MQQVATGHLCPVCNTRYTIAACTQQVIDGAYAASAMCFRFTVDSIICLLL